MIGRDVGRGREAIRRLGGRARLAKSELLSLRGVRDLGKRIAADGSSHLLVNDAGGKWSTRREAGGGLTLLLRAASS